MTTKWGEHNTLTHDSVTAKHLIKSYYSYYLTVSKHTKTRKNIETIYIALLKPSLNKQLKSNTLLRFRNDIT